MFENASLEQDSSCFNGRDTLLACLQSVSAVDVENASPEHIISIWVRAPVTAPIWRIMPVRKLMTNADHDRRPLEPHFELLCKEV